jgi:hypothetical protein
LTAGFWPWAPETDQISSAFVNALAENVSFTIDRGVNPDGWAGISSFIDWAGGNWNGFQNVSITYTSSHDIEIHLLDGLQDGAGFRANLPAGTNRTITLTEANFHQPNWAIERNFTQSKSMFIGVSIYTTHQGGTTTGSITRLVLNGVTVDLR